LIIIIIMIMSTSKEIENLLNSIKNSEFNIMTMLEYKIK
jgi:hypothetical protein